MVIKEEWLAGTIIFYGMLLHGKMMMTTGTIMIFLGWELGDGNWWVCSGGRDSKRTIHSSAKVKEMLVFLAFSIGYYSMLRSTFRTVMVLLLSVSC